MSAGDIHWMEGLFLQPHHLQTMQRRLLDRFGQERYLSTAFPFGLVEAELSADELRNRVVRFDRLRAIMPSGRFVDVPGNAEIPPLDIGDALESVSGPITVNLAIPRWHPRRGNANGNGTGSQERRLYRLTEVELADENTGENPQVVCIRQINARLVIGTDDDADLEILPLLRITAGGGEDQGLPQADPTFVPPCFVLHASPRLTQMGRDVANALAASHRSIQQELTGAGFDVDTMRGVQFGQLLRLLVLGRAASRLSNLVALRSCTPFALVMELQALLVELTSIQPDRRVQEIPGYDHEHPYPALAELCDRIRSFLVDVVPSSFRKVDFVREDGVLTVRVPDDLIATAPELYLGIRSQQDASTITRLVEDPDRFKLMPQSLTGRAFRGLTLVEDRHPPLQFPAEVGLHFFRVERDNERTWDRACEDAAVTVEWPDSAEADEAVSLFIPTERAGGDR